MSKFSEFEIDEIKCPYCGYGRDLLYDDCENVTNCYKTSFECNECKKEFDAILILSSNYLVYTAKKEETNGNS